MDWQQQLEHAIPHPSEGPVDLDAPLRAGRRAVRRRRAAAAAAVAAVTLSLGAVAWSVPDTSRGPSPVAVAPSPAVPSSTSGASVAPDATDATDVPHAAGPRSPVTYDLSGRLVVRPGWSIVRQLDGVVDVALPWYQLASAPERSSAFEVRRGDEVRWVLTTWDPSNGGSTSADDVRAGEQLPTLESWVDVQVAVMGRTSTTELVAFDAPGDLVGKHGVVIDQQVRDPDLGVLGRGAVRTAAALITVGDDRLGIVAVETDDETRYVPVGFPVEDRPDTLDAFVELVRDSGGRLP